MKKWDVAVLIISILACAVASMPSNRQIEPPPKITPDDTWSTEDDTSNDPSYWDVIDKVRWPYFALAGLTLLLIIDLVYWIFTAHRE